MSIETDISFWKNAANHLWAFAILLVSTVWAMLTRRISAIEKVAHGALQRSEFEGYVLRSDRHREELRESNSKLFDETRAIRDRMNEQHIELLKALHEIAKRQQ